MFTSTLQTIKEVSETNTPVTVTKMVRLKPKPKLTFNEFANALVAANSYSNRFLRFFSENQATRNAILQIANSKTPTQRAQAATLYLRDSRSKDQIFAAELSKVFKPK